MPLLRYGQRPADALGLAMPFTAQPMLFVETVAQRYLGVPHLFYASAQLVQLLAACLDDALGLACIVVVGAQVGQGTVPAVAVPRVQQTLQIGLDLGAFPGAFGLTA